MTVLFGIAACGYKGKLKSPTQIEAAEAKKEKKKAAKLDSDAPQREATEPPAPALPVPPQPLPGDTDRGPTGEVSPPEGK